MGAVRAGAGPAAHAAHSSTGQAELVAVWVAQVAQVLLEANQIAPSSPVALGGVRWTYGGHKDAVIERV